MTGRPRIFTARKILVASTGLGVAGAAVGYFLLSRAASEQMNYPTGNLMPPPPPHDAGMRAVPPLPIGADTLELAAQGRRTLVLVRLDTEKNVFISLLDGSSPGEDPPRSEIAKVVLADKLFAPGNSYVIAFERTGSGKTKPFGVRITAVDDKGEVNVAAYRRILAAATAKTAKCKCPPGDPLCSCL